MRTESEIAGCSKGSGAVVGRSRNGSVVWIFKIFSCNMTVVLQWQITEVPSSYFSTADWSNLQQLHPRRPRTPTFYRRLGVRCSMIADSSEVLDQPLPWQNVCILFVLRNEDLHAVLHDDFPILRDNIAASPIHQVTKHEA